MKNTSITDYEYKGFIIFSPDEYRWVCEPKWLEPNEQQEYIYNNNLEEFKTITQAKKAIDKLIKTNLK